MSFYAENFQTVFGVKNNIQALRNKVLELAIQGKLVEQDPNDEPAFELIKRIKSKKDILEKERKIWNEKPLKPIEKDEIPFEIPKSWEWIRFGELIHYEMGKTPQRNESKFWNDDYYWVSIADMIPYGYVKDTKEKVSAIALKEKFNGTLVPKGTLIMSFKLTVGRVSILNIDAVHNEAIISIYPYIDVDNTIRNYLFKILTTMSTYGDTKSAIKGKTLNSKSISNILIPLPSLAEQQRIAARIEFLMSKIDKLEETLQRKDHLLKLLPQAVVDSIADCQTEEEFKIQLEFVTENFQTIFQTPESMQELRNVILQLAIEGKLLPQSPNDEPAIELLKKIKVEKNNLVKEGKIKKEKPLKPIEEEEIPFKIPESWEWVRVGFINTYINGDRSNKYPKTHELLEDGIPFISTKNFYNGYVNLNDSNMQFISPKKFQELSSGKLEDSDLLFVLRGSVGKMAEFKANDKYDTGFINAQIVISRLVDKSVLGFTKLFYNSPEYFRQINIRSSGSAVPQLSADELSKLIIPIPPLHEQERIVQKVESFMHLISELENKFGMKNNLVENMASL